MAAAWTLRLTPSTTSASTGLSSKWSGDYKPQPGAIGFGELGGIVSEANNRGINVLFSVVNTPEWARAGL